MANKAEIPDEFLTQLVEWQSEGLSLRAIATKLVEAGGPAVDPKTIAARLKKPVQSLEHITESIRHLAVPLESLKLDPRNARRHPDGNLAAIKGSLKEFGQMKPIVANKQTNGRPVVIAGNGTIEAAKALGWTHIAAIIVNISETTAQAFALADNRTSELAEWDNQTLAAILMELENDDVDVAALGFDDEFVKGVLEATNQQEGDDEDDSGDDDAPIDKAAELQKKWSTERGQIWEIPSKSTPGKCHRVMCGDCREPADVSALLDGQKVNVAFTSPPYASQRKYDEESGFLPIKPDAYAEWFDAVQANVRRHLAEDGSWFVNIKEHCEDGQRHLYVKDLTITHVRKWGWRFVDEICWRDTRNGMPGKFVNRFKDAWEPIFHFCQRREIRFNPQSVGSLSDQCFDYSPETKRGTDRNGMKTGTPAGGMKTGVALPSNVLEIAAQSEYSEHSAGFPIALPLFFIKAYSDPCNVIFDPFLGSGTTMIAAEKEGRICCGMELSPKYLGVILERATNAGLEPRLTNAPTI